MRGIQSKDSPPPWGWCVCYWWYPDLLTLCDHGYIWHQSQTQDNNVKQEQLLVVGDSQVRDNIVKQEQVPVAGDSQLRDNIFEQEQLLAVGGRQGQCEDLGYTAQEHR